jgi:hypothetical protein
VADSAKVEMGVCNVEWDGSDVGYTKGFVKVNFSAESLESYVDQADAPLSEVITKQNFEVVVPLAETDLSRFEDFFPGATYVLDGGVGPAESLEMSGAAGANLADSAKKLIIKPLDANGVSTTDANKWLTIQHAVAIPNISFAYEKENIRVFEVTFRALVGVNGFVVFGDETAVAA